MICQIDCKAQTFNVKDDKWEVDRETFYVNAANTKHALRKAIAEMKKKYGKHQEIEAVVVP